MIRWRHGASGLLLLLVRTSAMADDIAVSLPAGVRNVWDAKLAARDTTPTRERICVNGLWRWQPATNDAKDVPASGWGWFKVPGCWPGISDYMQSESQTLYPHPAWKDARLGSLTAAWYQREIEVPGSWKKRRIALSFDTLNSFAAAYVDGVRSGEITFPGGELDLTAALPPGKHVLSLLVIAMPQRAVMISYSDSARAKEVKGEVERRGLCGDVWLVGTPPAERVTGLRVGTSVRNGSVTFSADLAELKAGDSYRLKAVVSAAGKAVKEFASGTFTAADLRDGRWSFTTPWKPDALWDTDSPGNQFDLSLALERGSGKDLDVAFPARFGFREFTIEGKDWMLNGIPFHGSVLPLDNLAMSEATATYESGRETFARLQAAGFNAVYCHNYGTEPGTHLAFDEILRAADDAGMLVFFAMPHFGQYEWKGDDADRTNGYARHAAAYAGIAGTHPSVVLYAMSHNGCGYAEDMNPDLLGVGRAPRSEWSDRGAQKALRAEAIVRELDPDRLVYHHSGGDLGSMDTVNFYANWVPAQEMADWMEPWSKTGVKPVFLCEYGSPLSWDFAMYRGWYQGDREFGSAAVPWELCIAEWSAQDLGDRAFNIGPEERRDLIWEAERFRDGKLWHRWDYPVELGSSRFEARHEIFARYLTAEIRAFRGFGLSGYCLWDHGHYWIARDGADGTRQELPIDWDRLQRPGFSPDFRDERYTSWEHSYDRADWIPTQAGKAILRNNRPLLAWIAGSATAFTNQDHLYRAGETVPKTVIVINDSRKPVTAECSWSCDLPVPVTGKASVTVLPGRQTRIPVDIPLPAGLSAGPYAVSAKIVFNTGETQSDVFTFHVLNPDPGIAVSGKIAVFDPAGETTALLESLGVKAWKVDAGAKLDGYTLLVIGRRALTRDGPGPDLSKVRTGLKVVVFEQSAEALEQRLGFRAIEYGLRRTFARIPGHPVLTGVDAEHLRDWRGAATLVPDRREYRMDEKQGPVVDWAGIPVPRVWRCGNRGSVASVLIEKPAKGDFLPIVDGGFSLQYAPVLEYREGKGMIVFCQLDVTARTESDPAADRLVSNLLAYAAAWKPGPRRSVAYAGERAGSKWLEAAGFRPRPYTGGPVKPDEVLVIGPGAKGRPSRGDGRMIGVGLDGKDSNAAYPPGVRMNPAVHINAVFESAGPGSPLAGIGPADVHSRAAIEIPLVADGPKPVGDGVLAVANEGRVVFDQLAPWKFEPGDGLASRKTYRRSSALLSRLLANQGAAGSTPLLARFKFAPKEKEDRYLSGLYLDRPIEWDDPYRFFRW